MFILAQGKSVICDHDRTSIEHSTLVFLILVWPDTHSSTSAQHNAWVPAGTLQRILGFEPILKVLVIL